MKLDQQPFVFDSEPQSIVIFRALYLGDMLCAVPALRALRQRFPAARIHLISLPWARNFATRFASYIDHFIEFPGYPGLPERPCESAAIPEFLASVQALHADLVLQLQGSGQISNPLAALLGGRLLAGLYRPGEFQPDPRTFAAVDDDAHEILRPLRVLRQLGIPERGLELEFPIRPDDAKILQDCRWYAELQDKAFICLHPGARSRGKCWSPRSFARTADQLAAAGYSIVLTGSRSEGDLVAAVMEAMQRPAINSAADDLPLGALAALLQRACLLVCNDTGLSHLAAALATPSLVLFSATDPRRWAPLQTERHLSLSGEILNQPEKIAAIGLALLERLSDQGRIQDMPLRLVRGVRPDLWY